MTPMREAALRLLEGEKGVFLRCDRGESLYATNAPARTEKEINWQAAGFLPRTEGNITFLMPEEAWVGRLEMWLRARVSRGRVTRMISGGAFGGIMGEDMALWIEGVKRLEMKGDPRGYEKLIRQRAAVCLREKRGGGTLVSCALMADLMYEGGVRDED